jgi:hypothetical protein
MSDLLQRLVDRVRRPQAPVQPLLPSRFAPSPVATPWRGDAPEPPEPAIPLEPPNQTDAGGDRGSGALASPPRAADASRPDREPLPDPAPVPPAARGSQRRPERRPAPDDGARAGEPVSARVATAATPPVDPAQGNPREPAAIEASRGDRPPVAAPVPVLSDEKGGTVPSLRPGAVRGLAAKEPAGAPSSGHAGATPGEPAPRPFPAKPTSILRGPFAAAATGAVSPVPVTRTEIPRALFARAKSPAEKSSATPVSEPVLRAARRLASVPPARTAFPGPGAEAEDLPGGRAARSVPAAREVVPSPPPRATVLGQGPRPRDAEGERGIATEAAASDARPATPGQRRDARARDSRRADDGAGPVEVHVSIGHIEVRSAQPKESAPKRRPQRPRVTLDQFLSQPHHGGPR